MSVFGKYLLLIVTSIIIFSCKHIDVFEKSNPIPGRKWKSNYASSGSFDITDTSAYYKMYLVLRHTDAYKYNNIWLNIGIQQPDDTMAFQKVNYALGSDATGWYGSGMDDIWEIRILLSGNHSKFNKPGNYKFSIFHIMRDNPLPEVMNAGIRVEKVTTK